MSFEIHMYSAVAQAAAVPGREPGRRHPMLVFLRQAEGSAHELGAAAAVAIRQGWEEVDITRAGTLPPDADQMMEAPVRAAYAAAAEGGEGLLVFEAAVQAAPRK